MNKISNVTFTNTRLFSMHASQYRSITLNNLFGTTFVVGKRKTDTKTEMYPISTVASIIMEEVEDDS